MYVAREVPTFERDGLTSTVLVVGLMTRSMSAKGIAPSTASRLIHNGERLAYVKDQPGYSSIQVTVDISGHLILGANRAAVDRLDEITSRTPDVTTKKEGATA